LPRENRKRGEYEGGGRGKGEKVEGGLVEGSKMMRRERVGGTTGEGRIEGGERKRGGGEKGGGK